MLYTCVCLCKSNLKSVPYFVLRSTYSHMAEGEAPDSYSKCEPGLNFVVFLSCWWQELVNMGHLSFPPVDNVFPTVSYCWSSLELLFFSLLEWGCVRNPGNHQHIFFKIIISWMTSFFIREHWRCLSRNYKVSCMTSRYVRYEKFPISVFGIEFWFIVWGSETIYA